MLIAGAKPPGITALERAYALGGYCRSENIVISFAGGRGSCCICIEWCGGCCWGFGLVMGYHSLVCLAFFTVEIRE